MNWNIWSNLYNPHPTPPHPTLPEHLTEVCECVWVCETSKLRFHAYAITSRATHFNIVNFRQEKLV